MMWQSLVGCDRVLYRIHRESVDNDGNSLPEAVSDLHMPHVASCSEGTTTADGSFGVMGKLSESGSGL